MRWIPIGSPDGNLAEDAAARVVAHVLYPDSPTDRDLFAMIAGREQARFRHEGPATYDPGSIVAHLFQAASKAQGQRMLCGLVTICLCTDWLSGLDFSLIGAAKRVSHLTSSTYKIPSPGMWLKERPADRLISLKNDPKDIAQDFRNFSSVAHICAALITCTEYHEHTHIFEPTPEFEKCFIATAACFERIILELPKSDDWNLWRLTTDAPEQDWPRDLAG